MAHRPLPVSAVEFRIVQEFGAAILASKKKPFFELVLWSPWITSGETKDV